jgi:23S rRNA (uracil1939-C5)-methyltransferase
MAAGQPSIDVQLTTFAFGGECIGRLADGRAVFVPYGLPGELVRVQLTEQKTNFARGRLVDVVQPAPARIQPRCKHYGVCGGCHYQHMSYDTQLRAKRSILVDQLSRIGGLDGIPVREVIPSPASWNYRNSVQFHLDSRGWLGFQKRGSNELVQISECFLPEPALDALWRQLEFEPEMSIERIELRCGAEEELMVVLETSGFELPEFSVDMPLSAVHHSPAGEIVLAGDNYLIMMVDGQPFRLSAQSFFQVNTAQASAMIAYLLEQLPLKQNSLVLDVYCGVGLFSAFIAPKVARCVGIELSESACQDYAVNLDHFDNVELYIGAAERILPGLTLKPDIAIVDPPRSGLERKALDALISMKPATIAYVSCDPSTLARDAKRITQAGYILLSVQPFDLFPQTFHIESISIFEAGQGINHPH